MSVRSCLQAYPDSSGFISGAFMQAIMYMTWPMPTCYSIK